MKEVLIMKRMHWALRVIIVSAILLIGLLSVAEASIPVKDTVEVNQYITDSDAEKLVDKYYDKIKGEVSSLAESLKVPAEEVLQIYGKYHFIQGIIPIIGMAIGIIGATPLILMIFFSNVGRSDAQEVALGVTLGVFSVLFFLSLIGFFVSDSLARLYIPEYFVIQDILSIFK